jgi:hypothetical protein
MGSIELRGHVQSPGSVEAGPGEIGPVLDLADPTAAATHATVISEDGYRASIPLDTLRAGGLLSIEDEGLRLRVVDGMTLCWNVKDVTQIEVSVGKQPDDVSEKPKH